MVERYLRRTFLGDRTVSYHSSYGCPYRCNFCAVVTMVEGRWLAQTAEQVAGLDWGHTVAHWQRALATLAAEVVDGRADPTPSPETCEYCPLGPLCRVAELTGEAADD